MLPRENGRNHDLLSARDLEILPFLTGRKKKRSSAIFRSDSLPEINTPRSAPKHLFEIPIASVQLP